MTTKKHSIFSPSKSDRWLNCPGSALIEAKYPPEKGSAYALEGSFAHRVAEKALLSGKNAHDYVGTDVLLESGEAFCVTVEMADAVQVYLDFVRNLHASIPDALPLKPEHRVNVHYIHKDLEGTVDCSIAQPLGALHITDYKHGKGVVVEAENNSQMMIYALGELGEFEGIEEYETVELHIVQPRAQRGDDSPVKSWKISVADLRAFGERVRATCKVAAKPGAKLNAGEWCNWCRHAAACAELKKTADISAGDVFSEPVETVPALLPPAVQLTPDQIGRILNRIPMLEKFAKEVRKHAMERMSKGETIPGFKLVRKTTHRKWIDNAADLLELDLGDAVYEKKLITPAQAEKKFKGTDLSAYTTKPVGELTFAPESDKRPAVLALTAEDVFTNDEEGEE